MNIPLIATINHRTIDLRTKALKVKIYRNGETEAIESPYVPYYFIEDEKGDSYTKIASTTAPAIHNINFSFQNDLPNQHNIILLKCFY